MRPQGDRGGVLVMPCSLPKIARTATTAGVILKNNVRRRHTLFGEPAVQAWKFGRHGSSKISALDGDFCRELTARHRCSDIDTAKLACLYSHVQLGLSRTLDEFCYLDGRSEMGRGGFGSGFGIW